MLEAVLKPDRSEDIRSRASYHRGDKRIKGENIKKKNRFGTEIIRPLDRNIVGSE